MENKNKGLNINAKSFIIAIIVIFALMVLTYILTFIIPSGEYPRILDENGNMIIDKNGEFAFSEASFPFWKWILSPFWVLVSEGSFTIIAVIIFLLIIGGIFNSLDKCNFLKYMLGRIIAKFGNRKYTLLFAISGFFMAMGAFVGSFEECVPMVPIVVALSIALGWDALVGLGMSVIAVGCGFATGILNPFTLGVAQSLADLPMFSGIWLRILSGVLIYLFLALFLWIYAKKIDTKTSQNIIDGAVEKDDRMNKALLCFVIVLGFGILVVLSSTVIKVIQDYTMIVIVLMFLIAGISSSLISGMKLSYFGKTFINGVKSVLPAVAMILMASSVKYILTESKTLDTILYYAVKSAGNMSPIFVVLFMYLIALILNFFVSSGSAEAILLIPLLVPMAQMFGISSQICVLAYVYGDGFSNVLYPTNPVLLISLGIANVSYSKYFKWVWKFQLGILVLTSLVIMFGYVINY